MWKPGPRRLNKTKDLNFESLAVTDCPPEPAF